MFNILIEIPAVTGWHDLDQCKHKGKNGSVLRTVSSTWKDLTSLLCRVLSSVTALHMFTILCGLVVVCSLCGKEIESVGTQGDVWVYATGQKIKIEYTKNM